MLVFTSVLILLVSTREGTVPIYRLLERCMNSC